MCGGSGGIIFSATTLKKYYLEMISFVVGGGGDDFVKCVGAQHTPQFFTKSSPPPPTTNDSISNSYFFRVVAEKMISPKSSHNDFLDMLCCFLCTSPMFYARLKIKVRPRPKYDVPDLNCTSRTPRYKKQTRCCNAPDYNICNLACMVGTVGIRSFTYIYIYI